jgi:selenophosphate synthase
LLDNFWEHIDKYRKLGFDPVKWIPACSGEVDPSVFRSALQEVKKSSIKMSSSWFDSFYHIDGKRPELTRRVYRLSDPSIDKEVEVKRALAILRLHAAAAESPQLLGEVLQGFLKSFTAKVSATCTSAVLTEHQDAPFAMFDYIELHRGDKVGYMPAVTAVTQVTDITRDPDGDVHSSIAMTSAIDTLNLLGCGISSTYKMFPVYDGPDEELLDRIRSNLDAFTSRYNLAMEDYSSLKTGKLFYGTTAMATTPKELPTRYDQIEEGMDILVTNKMGGLAAVSLYTLGRMDSENIIKYETAGLSFESVGKAKDEAIKNLSEPHFALGKIVTKYLPDFGAALDKSSHITAVHPVASRGIFALGTLAALCSSRLEISSIPLRHSEIDKYATGQYLVDNSTASLNGCHVLIAAKDVVALVIEDLRKHNFAPEVIGTVSKKGTASVTFGEETEVGDFVASKLKLDALLALQVGHQPEQQPAA